MNGDFRQFEDAPPRMKAVFDSHPAGLTAIRRDFDCVGKTHCDPYRTDQSLSLPWSFAMLDVTVRPLSALHQLSLSSPLVLPLLAYCAQIKHNLTSQYRSFLLQSLPLLLRNGSVFIVKMIAKVIAISSSLVSLYSCYLLRILSRYIYG